MGFNLLVAPIAVVFSSRAVFWVQHGGGSVDQLKFVIAAFFVLMVLVFQCPLLIFMPALARARRRGLHEYGALAGGYTRSFHGKWLEGRNPSGEPLLGSSDIQSLADMGNSFQVVQGMRIVPIQLRHLTLTAIASVLPMLPLLSTVMPLEDILKRLLALIGG